VGVALPRSQRQSEARVPVFKDRRDWEAATLCQVKPRGALSEYDPILGLEDRSGDRQLKLNWNQKEREDRIKGPADPNENFEYITIQRKLI